MDDEKEIKVAAARKKLKKFQKKKKEEKDKASSNCSRENSPVCQLTNAKQSGANGNSSRSSSSIDVSKSVAEIEDQNNGSSHHEGSVSSETISMTTVINTLEDCPKSTAENLRQLELQMSSLGEDTYDTESVKTASMIFELEKRNSELAALLSHEKQTSMQYNKLNEELNQRLKLQDSQIESLQTVALSNNDNATEINGLKEKLEIHIQTIAILMTEKSDLQNNLANLHHFFEVKSGEVSDLHGLLDSSRQRVIELEASHKKLRTETTSLTNNKKTNSQQLHNLQTEHTKSSKMVEELGTTAAELREGLVMKAEENEKLSNDLSDVQRKFDLSQVHLQQLRDISQEEVRQQLQELQTKLEESFNQLTKSEVETQRVKIEKSQNEMHYQTFTAKLSTEIEQLKVQLSKENESYRELTVSKQELEIQIERNQRGMDGVLLLQEENKTLTNQFNSLLQEKNIVEQKYSSLIRDNGQLSQLVAEQSSKLDTLEATVDRTSTRHVNTDQLLESMQSDKVAAARALSQNKQLKEQLEELQDGFIMMSNKKLELTEKLERESHGRKSLLDQINTLENLLREREEEILRLNRRVVPIVNGSTNTTKNIHDNDDTVIEKCSDSLINEQCSDVPTNSERQCSGEVTTNKEQWSEGAQIEKAIDAVMTKFATTNIPEEPRINGVDSEEPLLAIHGQNREIDQSSSAGKLGIDQSSSSAGKVEIDQSFAAGKLEIDQSSVLRKLEILRVAHEALQTRFSKCMSDLATLTDENQFLDHLNQQLQVETDTVGDYITIYQFQRGVMKQQMKELNLELDLMKTEKEVTTSKVNKLQKLFNTLAMEADGINAQNLSNAYAAIIKKDQEGVITEDIKDVVSVPITQNAEVDESSKPSLESSDLLAPESISTDDLKKTTKSITVKKIIDLIDEMEVSSQLDMTLLAKLQPCSHCSGKLITI